MQVVQARLLKVYKLVRHIVFVLEVESVGIPLSLVLEKLGFLQGSFCQFAQLFASVHLREVVLFC